MKRALALSLFALAPLSAQAASFGLTSHSSNIYSVKSGYTSPVRNIPTLDLKIKKLTFQLTALELIESMSQEDYMDLGFSGYYTVKKQKISDHVRAVLQLGGSLDIQQTAAAASAAEIIEEAVEGEDGDTESSSSDEPDSLTHMWALFQPRIGLEVHKGNKGGLGIYVVSGIGMAKVPNTGDSDDDQATELAVGTGLQISAWIK